MLRGSIEPMQSGNSIRRLIGTKGSCNDFIIQSVLGAFSLGVAKRVVDRFDRVHQHFALAGSHRLGISQRIFDRVVYVYQVVWTSPLILPKVISRSIVLGNA